MKKITKKVVVLAMGIATMSSGITPTIAAIDSSTMASTNIVKKSNDNSSEAIDNSNRVALPTEMGSPEGSNNVQNKSQEKSDDTKLEESATNEKPASVVTPISNNLTLDMDPDVDQIQGMITHNMSEDGVGWPHDKATAKQLTVSDAVQSGDTIDIELPRGIDVAVYDTPDGSTAIRTGDVNSGIKIEYKFSQAAVTSFNISYFISSLGANSQYQPGTTSLPVKVTSGSTIANGSIIANNPTTSTYTLSSHNTGVNPTFTADGNSVYNFVMKTAISPTDKFTGITQAKDALISGKIHVPAGFKLEGASTTKYTDTNANVAADGGAIPAIPNGLSQPGGAGTDIIVNDVNTGIHNGTDNTYIYLYGSFATGTASGTYHFSQDLTVTPKFYDGSVGSFKVQDGNYQDIVIDTANPGAMAPGYSGVIEHYDSNNVDIDHEGFYSKSISNQTGLSGFWTGKTNHNDMNYLSATPVLAIDFNDDTVNQTNNLRDYVITLPKNWMGNTTDIAISTGPKNIISGNSIGGIEPEISGNEDANGPFKVTLDDGSVYTVSDLNAGDATLTMALQGGAHIAKLSGQAKILPSNNLQVRLGNAVIEDGTYNAGDLVPIQLDVHSETSDTDVTALGHLKYFDKMSTTTTQLSIKGDLDYDISGTYTQGQTFTTGSKWTTLNTETTKDSDTTDEIIIPGASLSNANATFKLPTFIVSSVAKGQIDLDQSKINNWGWTFNNVKYKPVITDLGTDPTTGEHLTKLDFSNSSVTIPANTNTAGAFFYPDALPWKVSDIAVPSSGTTSKWITQLTDANKDAQHPQYGGKVYDGSINQHWTITAGANVTSKAGLAGNKTGSSNFYTEATGTAGFDRGLKTDTNDDDNSGQVLIALTNGSKNTYTKAQSIISLPDKKANRDKFDMGLTGPITNLQGGQGTKALYSTTKYDVPTDGSDQEFDTTTSDWKTENQVTDWSKIRSVAVVADSIGSQEVISGYVPVAVDDIASDTIGDTAIVDNYTYAKAPYEGGDLSQAHTMKAKIWGTPQIKVNYEQTTDGHTSDGTVLATQETITGDNTDGDKPAYSSYSAQHKKVKGYTEVGVADNSGAESGTLTDATKDVTFLFRQDAQKVKVHYINVSGSSKTSGFVPADGQELTSALQTVNGLTNNKYTNKLAVPKGYNLLEQDPEATAGTFDDDDATDQNAYVYVNEMDQRIAYNVIDDSTSTNLETDVDFDHGGTNTATHKTQSNVDAIANPYLNGYSVVSIDKMPAKFDDDVDTDQIINIHLKKEKQKLYVHYINVSDSSKTSGWTPQDGTELNDAQQKVVGLTNDPYTNKIVLPKGYELLGKDNEATAGTFDDDKNIDQNAYVYVKASDQKVVYNVINDDTDKNIESNVAFDNGGTDTKLNKTQNDLQAIADGYKTKYILVSVDKLPANFDNDVTKDQVVNIHVKNKTVASIVTPKHNKKNNAVTPKHNKKNNAKNLAKKLPQTGEALMFSTIAMIFGIAILMTVLYLISERKRKN